MTMKQMTKVVAVATAITAPVVATAAGIAARFDAAARRSRIAAAAGAVAPSAAIEEANKRNWDRGFLGNRQRGVPEQSGTRLSDSDRADGRREHDSTVQHSIHTHLLSAPTGRRGGSHSRKPDVQGSNPACFPDNRR
jgi:hypothetical protein